MTETASQIEVFRAKALGTNVNAVSLLATDYLNHFNEALMLAELVVDMPDMLEDFKEWSPKHYKDHFRDSGIADKELAILAYDVAPIEYRAPFESTVVKLNKQINILQKKLELEKEELGSPEKNEFVSAKCKLIRELIDRAGGVINGQISEEQPVAKPDTQSDAQNAEQNVQPSEAKPEKSDVIEVSEGEMLDQSDIDALFD